MVRPSEVCSNAKSIGGVIILSALLLSGCGKRPEKVLGEKEMVKLMADMQLAEAYSNSYGGGRMGSEERNNLGKGVLAAHGVTQEELDSTLSWYGKNMDDYTELYDKVDKEIASRRKKLMKEDSQPEDINSVDMLWPYKTHGTLSTLGNSDAWILSVDMPQLDRGDVVEWSMRMSETTAFTGVLGVEYSDGTSDAFSQMLSGNRKHEMRLQTDTGKTVTRIYGTVRLKDPAQLPIYADSIMLRKIPYDSLEYHKHRSLRHYGVPVPVVHKAPKADSIAADSVTDVNESRKINNELREFPQRAKSAGIVTINPVSGKQSINDKKDTDKTDNKKDKSH